MRNEPSTGTLTANPPTWYLRRWSRNNRYSGLLEFRNWTRAQGMINWPIFSSIDILRRAFEAHFSPSRSRWMAVAGGGALFGLGGGSAGGAPSLRAGGATTCRRALSADRRA